MKFSVHACPKLDSLHQHFLCVSVFSTKMLTHSPKFSARKPKITDAEPVEARSSRRILLNTKRGSRFYFEPRFLFPEKLTQTKHLKNLNRFSFSFNI